MKTAVLVLIAISLFLFCTPSRDNPLDPASPIYTGNGMLVGKVLSYYQPFKPLSGIFIEILPLDFLIKTGDNGEFRHSSIRKGVYWVVATHPDFAPDTQYVEVRSGRTTLVTFHLDALPRADSIYIYTEHISRWFPTRDIFQAQLQCSVSDPDGPNDIDSVQVIIPEVAYRQSLTFNPTNGKYQGVIDSDKLPDRKLHDLIGKPLFISCRDKVGFRTNSEPFTITRIIDELPVAVSPSGNQTVGNQPEFSWQVPLLYFDHTFTVEIYTIEGSPTLFFQKTNIPMSNRSYVVEKPLRAGEYYWVVWIVDERGNRSRSKEARFAVEDRE